jgi:hypothetical protein
MKTTHILPILLSVVICSTSFGRGTDTTKKSKVITKTVTKSVIKQKGLVTKNCGFIVDQGVDIITEVYWIDIKNDSTGNVRKFELPREKWYSINMDAKFCVDSLKVW